MTTGVVITHAYRTAVGKSGRGTLRQTRPDEMLGQLMQKVLERVPELDPKLIDDVIIGCAMPEGEQGLNVARNAAIRAGIPVEVPAMRSTESRNPSSPGVALRRFISIVVTIPRIPPPSIERMRYFAIGHLPCSRACSAIISEFKIRSGRQLPIFRGVPM